MRHVFAATALAAIVFGLAACEATAQFVNLADRIEEDWVLVVDSTASPDGPQVNTVMGPTSDLSLPVVVLDINYRHDPVYKPGGLQVLVYGNYGLMTSTTVATNPLNQTNETVKWTQRMSLSGGTFQYVLSSVSSTTLGTFTDNLVLAPFNTTLSAFKDYSPAASVANSGGAWKTQGLKSLTLVQVRYYLAGILIKTDTTARTVDCTKPFSRP
ncbi:MAG: hypothetical protein LC745_06320 [Planctomycetia bacterium]|nr:hypothetical protein [Planctomycetia bacterium]